MQIDIAIPMLPARNIEQSIVFYRALRFTVARRYAEPPPDGYAILRRDALELHLFAWPATRPENSISACFIRVNDAIVLHRDWSALGFAGEGIPSVGPVGKRHWGMDEFTVIDPSGNMIRVGSTVHDPAE